MFTRKKEALFLIILACPGLNPPAMAKDEKPLQGAGDQAVSQVITRIVAGEKVLVEKLQNYRPIVETYIQNQTEDKNLGKVLKNDEYFLGKLDLTSGTKADQLIPQGNLISKFVGLMKQTVSMKYLPDGFASMILIDRQSFDTDSYEFTYIRREFLGAVRCLVFDVKPIKQDRSRFTGRIWVEDKDYAIVRFNGVNGTSATKPLAQHYYFHFDSWRLNAGPGIWLPAYVYSEESDFQYGAVKLRKLRFKGQTRIWGYDPGRTTRKGEFTDVLVDSAKDRSDTEQQLSPVLSLRTWESQAEENVLERLLQAALLAPVGEVDKVLQTVLNNLEITNNLDIQPEVRCRVLMITPFESLTVGRTIVLSRGLIDVLPDEASLALVLAHELGHVLLGHQLIDTKYAFSDRMMVDDAEILGSFRFRREPQDETAADNKAIELLKHSPYADKLGGAGLFLRAIASRAKQLPELIRPYLGDRLVKGGDAQRFAEIMNAAPKLEMERIDQIAALPLGARIHVDPWSGRIELIKSKSVALASAREKMLFEVSPLMPYLSYQQNTKEAVSSSRRPDKNPQGETVRP